jgi:hypothetical protein
MNDVHLYRNRLDKQAGPTPFKTEGATDSDAGDSYSKNP